jgi:GH24 family phage-related lysozyme (muramidase)
LGRAFNGWASGRLNKIAGKGEEAGLASADEAIAALLAGRGGAGYAAPSFTASSSGAPAPAAAPQGPEYPIGVDALPQSPTTPGGYSLGTEMAPPVDPTLELIKGFEGFRETPYWDVNALRTGYGSDTVTLADGSVVPVTDSTRVTREDADRDLQRRAHTEFAPIAASAVGAETFATLNPNQKAALTSIAYNYGELPSSVAAAVRSGDPQATAAAIAALGSHNGGINADRRAKEAEVYLGASVPGGTATYDTAGGAPAIPGGSGGMDIASLLALQKNPWVAQKYGGVVDALIGQQFSRQNALWEQQQKMADPMYQAQLAELTAPKVSEYDQRAAAAAQYGIQPGTPEYQRFVLAGDVATPGSADPFAGTKEIGGVLYGPDGQGGFVPLITPPAEPGYAVMAPEEVAALGLPPGSYQRGPKGEIKEVGGGGVNVSVSNGASEVGTIPQGYELFTDPNTGARSLRPIAGGPEDRTAKDAATAANKQTATDVITGAASAARLAADERAVGGWLGSVAAINPGSQNAEVYRQVEVLKANASAENIAAMRAASPTGAALGGVSDKDLALLASKSGALDPASPNFERDLDDYERTVLRLVHGVEAGDRIFEATRAAPDASAAGADGWTTLPNGVKVRVKP